MNNKLLLFIFLQFSVIIYTLAGVCGKLATRYEILSVKFIMIYCLEVAILGLYAILWQQIIKRVDIFVAYANKGTNLLWSMLFAILLFKEKITISNIVGIVVVMLGVLIINSDSFAQAGKSEEKR